MVEESGNIAADVTAAQSCVPALSHASGTTDGFRIFLHAAAPTATYDIDADYYEDGNRIIGAFHLAIDNAACHGDGTFDVRRNPERGQVPLVMGKPGFGGEIVIVDTDGNLVRHEVRVLR